MMTLSSTVSSTNAAALPTDCWRELDGRMFLCNAAGPPIHYGLDPVEIRAIVEESLTRRAGLGDRMSPDDQERQRRVAGIVRALFSVVSQDLRYQDAFEAAHRLAAEFGQWQVASALALDVALMHAAVRRLGESRVRQAVQLWVAQVRPQPRLSIDDLVRVATESGHHAEGVVGRIDTSSAEYRVALTRQDRFGPAEVTLPFEFVQTHRGKQPTRDDNDTDARKPAGRTECPEGDGAKSASLRDA